MTEFKVKDVIDYCYNDFVKIIDRRVIGISVTAEKEYVKLVIKI